MRYLSVLAICLALLPADLSAENSIGGLPWPTPNWDRELALLAAEQLNTDPEFDRLYSLARQTAGPELLQALTALAARPDWPAPAREAVLLQFTHQLRQLPPFSVDKAVFDFLDSYQSQTLVAHESIPGLGVTLFPIRATAAGVTHYWTRQQAALEATMLVAKDPLRLMETYANSQNVNIRAGIEDSVTAANRSDIQALLDFALPQLSGKPHLTGLLGKSAVAIGNRQAVADVLIHGAGYMLVEVTRQASQQFTTAELGDLLLSAIDSASPSTAALVIGVLAPYSIAQLDVSAALMGSLNHPDLGSAAALALAQWGSGEQREVLEAIATQDPLSLAAKRVKAALALNPGDRNEESQQ